ncbi:MAG: sulfide/dihydroorotate dehydrogenase-like FAD/NAD-binding protein [Thermodesulfovibrionales bacterium]|nr:sulfide/dihydroorotate dehydrogenase-like FAD/NAD-binding protein [Thermodesulfovibrionales bacterium]
MKGYRILHKEAISDVTKLIVVEAPHVARNAKAGQFVIIRIDEKGERIPLTIADYDKDEGSITMIFQEVGKTTTQLGSLKVGDIILNITGPLGHPSEIQNYGSVICVGGGVGIAPIYPIARALKEAGNHVISIIGARTRSLIFWEEKLKAVSDELVVCTDDGSYGRKCLVTEPLKEILSDTKRTISRVWAIGPAIMMKFVASTTEPFKIPTIVSLNTIMIDGTGMCGGCRVSLKEGAKFVCVDGPEFDAHTIDWELLLRRLSYYRDEETYSLQRYKHKCNLDNL